MIRAKLRELIEYMERERLIGGSNHSFFSAFELLTIVPSADFVLHNNAGGYLIEGIPHKRTVLLEYTHSNLQFFKLFNYMVNSNITSKIFSVFKLIFKIKSFKKISDIRKIFEETLDFYYIINVCRFIWKNPLIIYLTLRSITLKLFHNEAESRDISTKSLSKPLSPIKIRSSLLLIAIKQGIFQSAAYFSIQAQHLQFLVKFSKGGIGMSITLEDLKKQLDVIEKKLDEKVGKEEVKNIVKEELKEIKDRFDEIEEKVDGIEEKLRKQERKISKLDYELTRTIIQPKATRRNFAISPRGALHDEEELIASWKI